MNRISIALAGNPNCGKSTVFNALTGSRQHTGNWPGKTVERKEGFCSWNGVEVRIMDLPGAYSLTTYSLEEVITRNYILDEKPDIVVCVLDASNLERNLYLATQILELGVPVVVALNMLDMANRQGICIDDRVLSQALRSPVVRLIARDGTGIQTLLEVIIERARGNHEHPTSGADSGNRFQHRLRNGNRGRNRMSANSHCH
jgi:ferrous iron transport protein B